MISFLLRRLLQSVLTVLGVLTATFFLVRLSGDPTTLLLPVEATPEDVANFRAAFGLDQSWLVQYVKFLASVLEGDFGISLRQRTSALGLVLERLPATMELALTAFILGLVLAFADRACDAAVQQRAASLGRDVDCLGAPGDSGLLVRAPAHPSVLGDAALAAVARPRHLGSPRAARRHARDL